MRFIILFFRKTGRVVSCNPCVFWLLMIQVFLRFEEHLTHEWTWIKRLIIFQCINLDLHFIWILSGIIIEKSRSVPLVMVDFHAYVADVRKKTVLLDDICIHKIQKYKFIVIMMAFQFYFLEDLLSKLTIFKLEKKSLFSILFVWYLNSSSYLCQSFITK